MPYFSMNAKYTHTEDEMDALIQSQRHLSHINKDYWIEDYGARYDIETGQRFQLTDWHYRHLREDDRKLVNLYNPSGVIYRFAYTKGMVCPICKSTYTEHGQKMISQGIFGKLKGLNEQHLLYQKRCIMKLWGLFDKVPEVLGGRPHSHYFIELYNGLPAACFECVSPFMRHASFRRDLCSVYNDESMSELEASYVASEFILFHMNILAKKKRSQSRKAKR